MLAFKPTAKPSLHSKKIHMHNALIVLTTHPDAEQAKTLARGLLEERLAACINILPKMTSLYVWKNSIETGQENLLIIKTVPQKYTKLESYIKNQHPYELPEIIAVPIETGLADYLTWIQENTQ